VIACTPTISGAHELTLSDNTVLTADMYIPASGLVPNSAFVPPHFLDASGLVVVDAHLNLPGYANVWALGDVCATEGMQLLTGTKQSEYVARDVLGQLGGKRGGEYKPATRREYCVAKDMCEWTDVT
jgi:NADH dehydrogenase FAD-containing subunit